MVVTYVSEEGKAYQQYMRDLLLERRAWYRSPNPVEVLLLVCFADQRHHDIDNRVKPTLDALKNGNLLIDDKQVKRVEIRQGPPMSPATMFITCREIVPDYRDNLLWVKGSLA